MKSKEKIFMCMLAFVMLFSGIVSANEEYMFEADFKFSHFNGTTEIASLKYDVADGSGKWITPPVNVLKGGKLQYINLNAGSDYADSSNPCIKPVTLNSDV